MREFVNPYIAGNPVTSAEMFFGRADVFAFVRQALVGKHRDNVIILYGQRRTGKTSVLYQMSRHPRTRLLKHTWEESSFCIAQNQEFLTETPLHVNAFAV